MHPLVAEHHYAKTTEERLYKRDPWDAPSSRCIIAKAKKPPKSGLIC